MFRKILLTISDKDLRNKILQIFALLVVARILAHIPLPLLGAQDLSPVLNSDQFLSLLNTISGGSFGQLSFVMLGVGPYITASIVIQLLGVIFPKIREIQREEGEMGQTKINRWTRFLTIPLAALNGWGILQFLANSGADGSPSLSLPAVLKQSALTPETFVAWGSVIGSMVAGALIIMWIGEIITEYKMGNGVSLMILVGIVSSLPKQIGKLFSDVFIPAFQNLGDSISKNGLNFGEITKTGGWAALTTWTQYIVIALVTLAFVVFINNAIRRVVIKYSKSGSVEGKSRTMGGVISDLPIKINIAGVMPIIFAVSFILFPTVISRFFFTANVAPVRDAAANVSKYLSTQPNQDYKKLDNTANQYLGVYASQNPVQIDNIVKSGDSTEGGELFGFRISTFAHKHEFVLPETPTDADKEQLARKDISKNVFFDGTWIRFEAPATNFGFLPEFAIYSNGILAYTMWYFLLIIFFTYFYSSEIAFKTEEIADNLQKTGAYIPGSRPGKETVSYLNYVVNRINVFGALFLALIAILPMTMNDATRSFGDGTLGGVVGGTTLLILVSVTIECLKQVEAQLTAADYEQFTK